MDEVTYIIVRMVVSVVAVLIAAYLIPYIKTKTSNEVSDMIDRLVNTAVLAAEQVITGQGKGKYKKQRVLERVTGWLGVMGIKITESQLDDLIEAVVKEMNTEVAK